MDGVGHGNPSSPLDGKHDRTRSGVACHHRIWTTHTVRRCQAWHAIIAFGQHRRLDDVERGMPSPTLESTHGRTTSGVACHHRLWVAQTVERHQAWHAIIALGRQTQSNDVGPGMLSSPLDVARSMPSSPLDEKHGQMNSGVACHHRLWSAHKVERRRAWDDIHLLWTAHTVE